MGSVKPTTARERSIRITDPGPPLSICSVVHQFVEPPPVVKAPPKLRSPPHRSWLGWRYDQRENLPAGRFLFLSHLQPNVMRLTESGRGDPAEHSCNREFAARLTRLVRFCSARSMESKNRFVVDHRTNAERSARRRPSRLWILCTRCAATLLAPRANCGPVPDHRSDAARAPSRPPVGCGRLHRAD